MEGSGSKESCCAANRKVVMQAKKILKWQKASDTSIEGFLLKFAGGEEEVEKKNTKEKKSLSVKPVFQTLDMRSAVWTLTTDVIANYLQLPVFQTQSSLLLK